MKKKTLLLASRIGLIVFVILGVIFLLISVFNPGILPIILTVLFLAVPVSFLFLGLKTIHHEKRWVVEFLGEFLGIYGPGLVFLLPFLEKAREQVPLSEQRFRLYNPETGHSNEIDFKDGSAIPLGAFAFPQIIGAREFLSKQAKKENITEEDIKNLNENIFRIVYASADIKKQSITLIENMARSYLNSMTIDEGITAGKAGYNLLDGIEKSDDAKVKESLLNARESLAQWGAQLLRVTIADFKLSQDVIDARSSVLKAEKNKQAAQHKAKTISIETVEAKLEMLSALTGKTVAEIQEKINKSTRLSKAFDELSTDLLKMRMGYDAGRRFDVGVQGAEGGLKDILSILTAAFNVKKDS